MEFFFTLGAIAVISVPFPHNEGICIFGARSLYKVFFLCYDVLLIIKKGEVNYFFFQAKNIKWLKLLLKFCI